MNKSKGAYRSATIPLKFHLKKFLYWHENIDDLNKPYSIHRKYSVVAYMLRLMLEGKAVLPKYWEGPVSSIHDIECNLVITFGSKSFKDGRYFFSNQNFLNFNKIIQGMMNDSMVSYILMCNAIDPKMEEKAAILSFMDMIGITDDDVSWETLKKASYRLRAYRKLPMFAETRNLNMQEEINVFQQKKPRNNPFSSTKLSLAS